MTISHRLAEQRRRNGQSLQQVADAVGVSKAHVWELEKGRADNPSMALVRRLADHFGVSLSYLIDEEAESPDAFDDLHRIFRQARRLDPDDLQLIDSMVQTLLARRARSLTVPSSNTGNADASTERRS